MHKKGASSLEFILAFMLFASFTFAAIYFFNPVKTLKNMDYSRDYTLNKIIENTSVELDSYSTIINEPALQTMKIPISEIDLSKRVSAVDYSGRVIESSRSGSNFCIDRGNDNSKDFSTLYFSEDIPFPLNENKYCTEVFGVKSCGECDPRNCPACRENSSSLPINVTLCKEVCGDGIDNDGVGGTDDFDRFGNACEKKEVCTGITDASQTPRDYQIASILTDKVISEKRVIELRRLYDLDYSLLKEQFAIPADVDFSFSLVLGGTEIVVGNSSSEITREIFSETTRREILRTSGIPQFGELTVSVW